MRQAIRKAGAHLIFLPKYSPDLNPIEQLFAKLKTLLRKKAARTVNAIQGAIGELLDSFTPQECANYLTNAGYASNEKQNALGSAAAPPTESTGCGWPAISEQLG